MSFVAALQALTATGAFAARAFLPLFLLGLIARFPELITWLPFCPDPPLVLPATLAFMSSTWCLLLLGLLALDEIQADKHPDVRDMDDGQPLPGIDWKIDSPTLSRVRVSPMNRKSGRHAFLRRMTSTCGTSWATSTYS